MHATAPVLRTPYPKDSFYTGNRVRTTLRAFVRLHLEFHVGVAAEHPIMSSLDRLAGSTRGTFSSPIDASELLRGLAS